MTCHRVQVLIQKSLDGTLAARERRTLDVHVDGCAACRRTWDEHRQLARRSAAWVQAPAQANAVDDAFTAQVMARIAASSPAPITSGRRRAALWPSAVGLSAVLGVLALLCYQLGPAVFAVVAAAPAELLPRPQTIPEVLGGLLGSMEALPRDAARVWINLRHGLSLPGGAGGAWVLALLANGWFFLRASGLARKRVAT